MAEGPEVTSGNRDGREGPLPVAGRRVGRYEIIRQIGRGGMAVVYLARQEALDREVALKELGTFHASDPQMAHRFLRESQLAGSLNHPNIVTVLEYFEDGGIPYIAMEYVRRGSLRPYVGRMSFAQFVGVMEGVLAGLAHAESHGIVHRDLKPENLMVTMDGRAKIADFGIAKATQSIGGGAFLTAVGTTVGTPSYMAPEQAMGQDIGPWTDLYSVGIMAWEHLVGHVPFHDSDVPMVILTRQLNEDIPSAATVRPDADPALSEWVDRLLVKRHTERAQTPAGAWDELEEIIIQKLGPRWRREARLPTPSEVINLPHPLTPAPFESQRARTPQSSTGSELKAPTQPDWEYLTFGRPGEDVTPSAADVAETQAPIAPPPVQEPPEPLLEPDSAVSTEPAPAAEPEEVQPTESEPPPAATDAPAAPDAPAPPVSRDPTYVTFGRSPGVPSPAAPPIPDEPAPAEVASEEEAAPAAEVTPLPVPPVAEVTPLPEPVAPPPEPETEAEAEAEAKPERAGEPTLAPTTPAEVPTREPRRPIRVRRLAVAAVLAGVAAAVALGFLIAPKSSPPPAAAPSLVGSAYNGPIGVSFPAGWQRQPAVATPGLKLANEIAVGPTKPRGGVLVIGTATTTGPGLLPASLSAVPGTTTPQVITLSHAQFYRYLDVSPPGAGGPESLYALPTTVGTVIGACVLQGGGTALPSGCERVLSTLQLANGKVLGLGPSTTFGTQLSSVIGKLNTAVSAGEARLQKAGNPGAQVSAANQLSAAYDQAAAAITKLQANPAAISATAALATALRKTGQDYTVLTAAAKRNDGHAYDAARTSLAKDATAASAALSALANVGYTLG